MSRPQPAGEGMRWLSWATRPRTRGVLTNSQTTTTFVSARQSECPFGDLRLKGIVMFSSNPLFLGLLLAGLVATAAAWQQRRSLTRPLRGRRRSAVIDAFPARSPSADEVGRALMAQTFDRLGRAWTRDEARVAQLKEAVKSHQRTVDSRLTEADRLESAKRTAGEEAVVEEEPEISARQRAWLTTMLAAGDVGVVTAAIMSTDDRIALLPALVTSFAIAGALLLTGKFLGEAGRRLAPTAGKLLLVGAIVLIGFAISLLLLRVSESASLWAWILLGVSPALGTAAVIMLGPSSAQLRVARLTRQTRKATRRLTRAMRTRDRRVGQLRFLERRNRLRLSKIGLAAHAEGVLYSVEDTLDHVDELADRFALRLEPSEDANDAPVQPLHRQMESA